MRGCAPAQLLEQPVEGRGQTARKDGRHERNAVQGKRDWSVDNNAEGAFEDALDEFFTREEVLATLSAANDSKVGTPFRVPDIVIRWGMDQVAGRDLGYRTVARRISARMRRLGLDGISYSQFHKRAGRITVLGGTTDVTDARVMAFGTRHRPGPAPSSWRSTPPACPRTGRRDGWSRSGTTGRSAAGTSSTPPWMSRRG